MDPRLQMVIFVAFGIVMGAKLLRALQRGESSDRWGRVDATHNPIRYSLRVAGLAVVVITFVMQMTGYW